VRLRRITRALASIRRETVMRNACLPAKAEFTNLQMREPEGEPRFSRNSSQCSSGMDMKTSTTWGSNCVPEQRLISPLACESGKALRYGRSLIMASSESAMVKMRAPGNIVAFQAPRVTGAVKKFLVRQNDFRGIAQEWDADQHVVADFAMLAHNLLFVFVSGPGCAGCRREWPSCRVVKKAARAQHRKVGIGHGHGLRDGDAERVTVQCLRSPRPSSPAHCPAPQRVVVGLSSCAIAPVSCAVRSSQLLEISLVSTVLHDQARCCNRADAEEKLVFSNGFKM